MLYFTTDQLNTRFRSDVDDKLEGSTDEPDSENLWKDCEIYDYMTEAADATARGTAALFKLISLPVVAGENVIKLPASVVNIRFARLLTAGSIVFAGNQNQLVGGYVCDYGLILSGALFRLRGRPQVYARDRERKALVIVPTPTVDDTLEIQCSVTLSTPLQCGMKLPLESIPEQQLMLKYMKYLAYAKQDADTLDLTRSKEFKAEFDRDIEAREVELRRERRTPSSIRMEYP